MLDTLGELRALAHLDIKPPQQDPAEASSIWLSAPKAINERLWAMIPEPIVTTASINIHAAVA